MCDLLPRVSSKMDLGILRVRAGILFATFRAVKRAFKVGGSMTNVLLAFPRIHLFYFVVGC